MLNRRHFLASGLAASSTGLSPAFAHSTGKYEFPEEYLPRQVTLETDLPPGEIHVVPNTFRLYWTLPDNQAIRYTVGVGRDNLYHSGVFHVGAKRKWPSWTPTPEMIKRDPKAYKQFEDGMPGGINNPLGARALYLYTAENRDTYLRIHGTSRPRTIGRAVSNGCARLINAHVIDLYDRVPIGTKVVLNEKTKPSTVGS
jgi:lipoprotein-anchoring transpeptidase ErfK/SrfK